MTERQKELSHLSIADLKVCVDHYQRLIDQRREIDIHSTHPYIRAWAAFNIELETRINALTFKIIPRDEPTNAI